MSSNTEKLLFSIPDAAEALSMSPATVRRRISDGTLKSMRIGSLVRIPRDELTALISRQMAEIKP